MAEQKQETPRPWAEEPLSPKLPWQHLSNGDIVDANGVIVLKVWNFYESGVITIRAVNAHDDLERQRDELVAAAKAALGYLEHMYGPYDSLVRQLKSAITTAEKRTEQPEGK